MSFTLIYTKFDTFTNLELQYTTDEKLLISAYFFEIPPSDKAKWSNLYDAVKNEQDYTLSYEDPVNGGSAIHVSGDITTFGLKRSNLVNPSALCFSVPSIICKTLFKTIVHIL